MGLDGSLGSLEEGPRVIGLLLELLGDGHELGVPVLFDLPPREGIPGLVPVDLSVRAEAEKVEAGAHNAGSDDGEEGDELYQRNKRFFLVQGNSPKPMKRRGKEEVRGIKERKGEGERERESRRQCKFKRTSGRR